MNYKRENQISELELNSFRQIEINKITSALSQKRNRGFYVQGLMSFLVTGALVVVLFAVFFSPNGGTQLPVGPEDPSVVIPVEDPNDPNEDSEANIEDKQVDNNITIEEQEEDNRSPYENETLYVTELSTTKYMVHYQDDLYHLELSYDAYIVQRGVTVPVNDSFDMKMRYTPVSQEIQDTVDVEFDLFKLDAYRFFLEISVNGESKYTEFDNLPTHHSRSISGLQLDIIDFQTDITDIFDLIELYPPVFTEERNSIPHYDINPLINELTDQRLIDNYTTYVQEYYVEETYYGTEFDKDKIYIQSNSMIILDDLHNIEGHSVNIYVSDHENNNLNVMSSSFEFIHKEESYNSKTTVGFESQGIELSGGAVSFNTEVSEYTYLLVDLDNTQMDLTDVASVTYEYKAFNQDLSKFETQEMTLEPIFYGGILVTEPVVFPVNGFGTSSVHLLHVTFLDNAGQTIYEFDTYI